ncbi:MAG: COX15/CtaA family protein [Bryobacteraceae bacterium]
MIASDRGRRRFALFAWAVVAFNIPVILWGAFVRISFSGDGCGDHWPFCNGQVIPTHMAAPMAIEFTHRAMTGLDTLAVLAMCGWAFALFPRKHAVRRYSVLSVLFLFIEALLGAGLVLLQLVDNNHSSWRAVYLSAHLTNTMLLLAILTTTAWAASNGIERIEWRRAPRLLPGALLVVIAISITGTIAALGDTLFPSATLASGMARDFSSTASLLLRLRMIHPAIAVLGAAYLMYVAGWILQRNDSGRLRASAARVLFLTLLQVIAGMVNIALLAPLWMQLLHLFVADVLWISVVVLTLDAAAAHVTEPVPGVGASAGVAA